MWLRACYMGIPLWALVSTSAARGSMGHRTMDALMRGAPATIGLILGRGTDTGDSGACVFVNSPVDFSLPIGAPFAILHLRRFHPDGDGAVLFLEMCLSVVQSLLSCLGRSDLIEPQLLLGTPRCQHTRKGIACAFPREALTTPAGFT